jgi:hypothetical protein
MKVSLIMPVDDYHQLLKGCELSRPEYLVLTNGRIPGSSDDARVEIACQRVSARKLLELANQICPDAARHIEKSLAREL